MLNCFDMFRAELPMEIEKAVGVFCTLHLLFIQT